MSDLMPDDLTTAELPSDEDMAKAVKDWGSRMEEVGTPEDISDDARKGFESVVDQAKEIDASDFSMDNLEELEQGGADASAEEKKQAEAFADLPHRHLRQPDGRPRDARDAGDARVDRLTARRASAGAAALAGDVRWRAVLQREDAPMAITREGRICSFCGKPGGPGTDAAPDRRPGRPGVRAVRRRLPRHPPRRGQLAAARGPFPWERMDDAELLATLPQILASAEQNTAFAHEWVDLLRSRNISWAEIGRALGVSRQAAWERFSRRKSGDKGATA